MRKFICAAMAALILILCASGRAYAVDDSMSFLFELTVDGGDTKEVKHGDVITLVLKLKRTDSSDLYTMYAMQDEIRYDSQFLELVEDSMMLSPGIATTDIGRGDRFREFYMNYLSMSGGAQWKSETLIGSVQFRVIGESGVTKISNQDFLVSLRDGSDSYLCEANEITLILTTECIVSFKTNGGNEIADHIVIYGEKIVPPEDPVREGYRFDGWYTDIHLTDEWDFEEDTVQGNMSLYAKWVEDASVNIVPGNEEPQGCFWWWILLLILLLILLIIVLLFIKKKMKKKMKKK